MHPLLFIEIEMTYMYFVFLNHEAILGLLILIGAHSLPLSLMVLLKRNNGKFLFSLLLPACEGKLM